jgi:MFS superfamily sulfate permease-like transporter
MALPLSMAFAIASGVNPERGLFTAIIGGATIAALGGSRVQIGGPTGAFIPILYAIVVSYGVNNMLAATFLAVFFVPVFFVVIRRLFPEKNVLRTEKQPADDHR